MPNQVPENLKNWRLRAGSVRSKPVADEGMQTRPERCAGVSPLRGTGLLRCASSREASRPFGPPSLTRARRRPPRSLARRVAPDCSAGRLAGALANAAIKAAPSSRCRTAESGRQRRRNGRQRPVPVPGDRGPCFLHGYVNEARLTNWPALRSRRCASFAARRPDRHPGQPPCPMPGR